MAEQQEQVVRRLIDDVWNKGNLEAIPMLYAENFVNHDPMNPGQGIIAARELVEKYRHAFPDVKLTIEELFSAGDRVVVRWQYSGTHRGRLDGINPTGRTVKGSGQTIYRFAGGRIQEAFVNWDALGLMQQLGVVTLPGKAAAAGV